ncbi:MAG: hypothetical protein ACREU3_02945 [Steroidobacteraceae bacterium]
MTDEAEQGGFDEVCLADHTQLDALGAVDLFAVTHASLQGRFPS